MTTKRTTTCKRCRTIGILGGIGSGKSTIARLFAELGAKVLDADAICADLHRTAAVKRSIRAEWGRAVFRANGELDRRKMARMVFSDAEELGKLNRILHPKVEKIIKQSIRKCDTIIAPPLCIIDAPLLVESGLVDLCDAIVFVEARRDVRARRLVRSRRWSPNEMKRREAHQEPLERKKRMADYVIRNSGNLNESRKQVKRLAALLKGIGEEHV